MFLEWENNSGKFQNNAVNDVKQISLSHVIKKYWKIKNSLKIGTPFGRRNWKLARFWQGDTLASQVE